MCNCGRFESATPAPALATEASDVPPEASGAHVAADQDVIELQAKIGHLEQQLAEAQVAMRERAKFVLQDGFSIAVVVLKRVAERIYESGNQMEANALWLVHSEIVEFQKLCRALPIESATTAPAGTI